MKTQKTLNFILKKMASLKILKKECQKTAVILKSKNHFKKNEIYGIKIYNVPPGCITMHPLKVLR